MACVLPPLPYAKDALKGFLSADTLTFHHDKHLNAYVETTNKLVQGTEFEGKDLVAIIMGAQGPLFNTAAQAWNHEFYFKCLAPEQVALPAKIAALIDKNFESLDNFKAKFLASATGNFGSGWTWLVQNGDQLEIVNTSNAGNPLKDGKKPLLTVDVWEHAYYLDFQNRRPDYVKAFLEHINWDFVESNL